MDAVPDGAHSHLLVVLSLFLALLTLLFSLLLGMVAVAAAAGVPVPLLAALPAVSSALAIVQLLALAGARPDAPAVLADLAQPLLQAALAPGTAVCLLTTTLGVVWLRRSGALQRHIADNGQDCPKPHSLAPGAWELRAIGLLALPWVAAATSAVAEHVTAGRCSVVVLVLVLLMYWAVKAYMFASEVIAQGSVVRTALPRTAGGAEVFADRVCNELLALPACPPVPSVALFGDWMSSPSWCVAPAVASLKEVEHHGAKARSDSWALEEQAEAEASSGRVEDEQQGRPLLVRSIVEHEDTGHSEFQANDEGDLSPDPLRPGAGVGGVASGSRPSSVAVAHPVLARTASAYEVRARDLVAGVACVPWLDCAVPAGAMRRLEELGSDVILHVHPGQLSGPLTSGRFAACFDWGTRWPWRWSVELVLKTMLGLWVAGTAPPHRSSAVVEGGDTGGAAPLVGTLLGIVLLVFMVALLYFMRETRPYEHSRDNAAVAAALRAAVLVVGLTGSNGGAGRQGGAADRQGLAYAVAIVAALLAMVPCCIALLAALGLLSATLGRLEAQGLHDRMLPNTVDGWGATVLGGRAAAGGAGAAQARPARGVSSGCEAMMNTSSPFDGHAVEVIIPGARAAFTIPLPGMARPRVVQAQLLPPVAGAGDNVPEASPRCTEESDRARLPVPAALLFPRCGRSRGDGAASSSTAADEAAPLSSPHAPQGGSAAVATAPLAALMAPGRPGRLVYAEAARNEGGADWRGAVHGFFGLQGSSLADEAQRLIEAHAAPEDDEAADRALVVVEVLPAFAAEFMDERAGP